MDKDREEFLTDGEEIIYTVTTDNKKGGLFLTNKRVVFIDVVEGFSKKASFKDISFKHISSIEWAAISHPWLLYSGLVGLGLGLIRLMNKEDNLGLLLLIVGFILVVLYYYLRKAGIVFVTANEKIPYEFGGENAKKIVEDVSKVIRGKG